LTEGSLSWLVRLAPLVEARRAAGMVRSCHGDLHLANICLWDGRPTLFDAIEFNEDFACIDVFYDIAFLAMDLAARDLGQVASWVLNRYLERTDDLEGLATLPLFLSLRAAIRAHVSAAIMHCGGGEPLRAAARDYMARAQAYLHPPPPRLLAVGGLSGSGKSRLARDLSPFIGAAPGAVVLRTDVLRKRLMGVSPETRLPEDAYGGDMTQRTYRRLADDIERAVRAGHSVIADAVFGRAEQRDALEAVARRLGIPFQGFWLETEPDIMRERITTRRNNASDATVAVLDQQLSYDVGPVAWHRVDSSGSKEQTLAAALKVVDDPRH
jgi:predicted kinase